MRIGVLAPPWLPVPPTSYGGIEAVVDLLVRGLTQQGVEVVLWTVGDSSAPVPKRYAVQSAVGDMNSLPEELAHVALGYVALADCDLVHDHTVAGPAWSLSVGRRCVVTTCHAPMEGLLAPVYREYSWRLPVIAISHDQASRAPDVRVARVIHHGIDVGRYPPGTGDGEYLLFLGRMAPEKGAAEAVQVARAAGLPLKIAAKMRDAVEQEYFASEVEPLLGDGVEYLGEVGGDDKLRLLGAARALLNPIRWPEPFGMVMIEALACGTPVVTYPHGAAPEIVDDGKTGFLCRDHAGMVEALAELDTLDRQVCRRTVVERFSAEAMVAAHVELYEELLCR
jgi:glycosyltransferase involved in cell wall biosynthesis